MTGRLDKKLQAHRQKQCQSDHDSVDDMMNSSSASTGEEPSSFIGDINNAMEDVDLESYKGDVPHDEEDADNSVTVGLSQVTLFPSTKLQQDDAQWDLPGSECCMLSIFGMCLDENQMIQLALEYQQQQQSGKKRKPYVPPPVTWSQPVLIVPPETDEMQPIAEDDSSSTGGSTTNNSSTRKQVKFETDGEGSSDDTDKDKHSQQQQHQQQPHKHTTIISSTRSSSTNAGLMRIILLHGRVARALGIRHGDCVTVQLAGQAKRQIVKASVDDHASFNVVMEAEWNDVVSSSYLKPVHDPRRELVDTNCNSPVLRSVKLAVEPEPGDGDDGEDTSHARFHLTPNDNCRQGILYFEGAMGVNDPAQGLIAGIGFCIYSCKDYSSVDDEDDVDDTSSSSNGNLVRRLKQRMPVNRTELVSSYRYLGRPFCENHADYSALIEGLEWLFRFQFDKVHIVGAPEVVAALQYRCKRPVKKYSKRKGVYSPATTENDDEDYGDVSLLKVPQLRKANTIAQDMISKAKQRGMEINYIAALDDESWEAGDLAEKAIEVGRNETQVMWENILESKRIDPPPQMRSSLTYSIDENSSSPSPTATFPDKVENLLDSEDNWSLLKGEDVLDEEFKLPADLESRHRTGRKDDISDDTEVTGHHSRLSELLSGTESTDDGYHEQEDDGTEEPIKKVAEKKVESPPKEAKRRRQHKDESMMVDDNPHWQDLQHLERGSARWRHLAKALKHKRMTNRHSSGQSATSQMSQASNESTWMMEQTSATKMPAGVTIKIMQKMIPAPTPTPEPLMPAFEASFDSGSIHQHRDYDEFRNGEEKLDYYYDGDDDETKSQEPFYGEIKPELQRGKESSSSNPNHNNNYTSSSNMCFFLDLGFLQGPQVIADEMVRIFVGGPRSEGAQEQQQEEAKVATPPRLSSSSKLSPVATPSHLEPPSVMRHDTRNLFHPKHKEDPLMQPTASPPRFRKQYAYV